MTLEHVAMAIVVVAVAVVAFLLGHARGVQLGEDEIAPNDPSLFGAQKNMSLFGPRVPVQPTERQLIAVMPEALIVVDSLASVKYVSPGAQRFGIVEDHAMTLAEIRDILRLVSTDSVVRERELSIPLDRAARAAAKNTDGKGIEAGKFRPSDTLYLHVRVGQISDDLFAIFISDMSEQRRFEIMRRDFVTNVSHELKTPAGAISLLAETIGDAADDPDMVKYFAGRVSKESERLTELVHRLIDLQKAQSAAAVLNAERISVLALVREAIVENQVNAESKHISMVLSLNGKQKLVYVEGAENAIDQDDVFINADHETIKTAVKNLVENAINYSRFVSSTRASAFRNPRWIVFSSDSTVSIPRAPAKQGVQDWVWPLPSIACRIAEALSPCGRVKGRGRPSPSPCPRRNRSKTRNLRNLKPRKLVNQRSFQSNNSSKTNNSSK